MLKHVSDHGLITSSSCGRSYLQMLQSLHDDDDLVDREETHTVHIHSSQVTEALCLCVPRLRDPYVFNDGNVK